MGEFPPGKKKEKTNIQGEESFSDDLNIEEIIEGKYAETEEMILALEKYVTDLHKSIDEKEAVDFEEKKKEFLHWVGDHFNAMLSEGGSVLDEHKSFLSGPADEKIYDIIGYHEFHYPNNNNEGQIYSTEQSFKEGQLLKEVGRIKQDIYSSEEYRTLVEIFMHSLVDFSIDMVENRDIDQETKNIFFTNIQKSYFEWSPDISQRLVIADKLLLAAKVNKNEVIRGQFGQKMNGELVYDISWASEGVVDSIIKKIEATESIEDRMNIVHQLVTVASAAAGEGSQSRNGFLRVEKVIKRVSEDSVSVIEKYFAKVSLERIKSEEENPSLGVLTYTGNTNAGRLNERVNEVLADDNETIRSRVLLPPDMENSRAYFASNDYVVFLDSANIPVGLMKKKEEELSSVDVILDLDKFQNLKAVVEKSIENNQNLDMSSVIIFLENNNVDINDVFSDVPEGVIDRMKDLGSRADEIEQEVVRKRYEKQQEIENLNEEKSQEVFDFVEKNKDNVFENFEHLLVEYNKHKNDGYDDGVFNQIHFLVKFLKNPFGGSSFQLNAVQEELISMFGHMEQFHSEKWRELSSMDFSEKLNDVIEINSEIDKISEGYFNIGDLKKFVDSYQEQANKHSAEVLLYSQMKDHDELALLKDKSSIDKMSFLHRPDVMLFIEDDLGIQLREVGLRDQISFLDFISEEDIEAFDELRDILKKEGLKKENFLRSFLSLNQGGPEMGEKILSIGENYSREDANAIFGKYAELVDATEKVGEMLQQEFPEAGPKVAREISESLLMKGKKLLEDFADAEEGNIGELLKDLGELKVENVLLVARYKALVKEGLITNIQDFDSIRSKDFSGEQALNSQKIMDFFEDSYEKNYQGYSSEGRGLLIQSLKENLQKEGSRIYVLMQEENILSAMLVNENPQEKVVYMSALNIDPALKEAAAGRVVLENTLQKYLSEGWRITAEATADNSTHYINQYGFAGYERVDTKDIDYGLKLEKNRDVVYESQDKEVYTKSKIREMVKSGDNEFDNNIAVWMSNDEKRTPEKLQEGYVITQMFRGSLEGERGNYFLLEKRK